MIRTTLMALLTLAATTAWLGAAAPTPIPAAQEEEFDHSHAAWTAILEGAVDGDGLVDYAALRKAPEALDRYLAALAATTPEDHGDWTRDQRFAFWINAYNAFTIQLVRDEGPVSSIRKLGGWFGSPWEIKFIPMPLFDPEEKGKDLMLDEIEHELIRPVFKDARVHAAVNCASRSCPPLRREAYRAADLDAQLDEQVRLWLADATRNRVTRGAKSLRVSKIFKWFDEDFGDDREEIVEWIADHVGDPELARDLKARAGSIKLSYLDYDWSINATKEKR